MSIGVRKKMKEIFAQERIIWYNNLKIRFKKIHHKGIPPSIVFLFGGGSSLPDIQMVLEEKVLIDWKQLLISGTSKIETFSLEHLEDIVDTTKNLKNPQIIPSLLISCSL